MFFLQTAQLVTKSTETILNYGAIGAMLFICMVVIYTMGRYFGKQLSAVTTRMNKYIDEDRAKMIDVISNNTIAFTNMMGSIDDLKNELHELKKLNNNKN